MKFCFDNILLRLRAFVGTSSSNDAFKSLGLRFLRDFGIFTLGSGADGVD